MEAAAGEDGEEPLRSAQVLGSELVETYTVMAAALRSVPFRATWGGVGVRRCFSEGKAGERGGQRCVLLGMSSDFGFTPLFFDGLRCSGAVLFRKLLAKPLVAHKALQHRPALCKASREPRLVERGMTGAPLSRGAAGQCLKIRLNGFPKKT